MAEIAEAPTYAELSAALVEYRAIASGRLTVPSGALLAAELTLGLLAGRLEAAQGAHHAKSDALIPPPALLEPGAPRPDLAEILERHEKGGWDLCTTCMDKEGGNSLEWPCDAVLAASYALALEQDAAAAREALREIARTATQGVSTGYAGQLLRQIEQNARAALAPPDGGQP